MGLSSGEQIETKDGDAVITFTYQARLSAHFPLIWITSDQQAKGVLS